MPVLPSYKNQSIDLLCKSIDKFLYECNTEIKGLSCQKFIVKRNLSIFLEIRGRLQISFLILSKFEQIN